MNNEIKKDKYDWYKNYKEYTIQKSYCKEVNTYEVAITCDHINYIIVNKIIDQYHIPYLNIITKFLENKNDIYYVIEFLNKYLLEYGFNESKWSDYSFSKKNWKDDIWENNI